VAVSGLDTRIDEVSVGDPCTTKEREERRRSEWMSPSLLTAGEREREREREREKVEDVAGGVGGILSRKRGGSKQAVLKTTGDYSLD
jgi:hypothetical protein